LSSEINFAVFFAAFFRLVNSIFVSASTFHLPPKLLSQVHFSFHLLGVTSDSVRPLLALLLSREMCTFSPITASLSIAFLSFDFGIGSFAFA
jgi:hypothetical protein